MVFSRLVLLAGFFIILTNVLVMQNDKSACENCDIATVTGIVAASLFLSFYSAFLVYTIVLHHGIRLKPAAWYAMWNKCNHVIILWQIFLKKTLLIIYFYYLLYDIYMQTYCIHTLYIWIEKLLEQTAI